MLAATPESLSWVVNTHNTNTAAVKVLNLSKDPITFRVVASQPRRYKVHPASGTLQGKGNISVTITLVDAPAVIQQFKEEGYLDEGRLLIFVQEGSVENLCHRRWSHEITKVRSRIDEPNYTE